MRNNGIICKSCHLNPRKSCHKLPESRYHLLHSWPLITRPSSDNVDTQDACNHLPMLNPFPSFMSP